VIVSILKKAEDGNGIIIRCYETDGKNSKITFEGPADIRNASRVSIIEEQLKNDPLPFEKNRVKDVRIGKFAIETLRLTWK
jgi:alpha-mannosidase